jgi:hypothetical protein
MFRTYLTRSVLFGWYFLATPFLNVNILKITTILQNNKELIKLGNIDLRTEGVDKNFTWMSSLRLRMLIRVS